MPINYKHYPPNWKTEIRPRILARAGEVRDDAGNIVTEGKCEFCGIENHLEGWRFPSGKFYTVNDIAGGYMAPEDESAIDKVFKRNPNGYKIVLTIAHLDHDKLNHDVQDDRLKALCQGCHLNYDRDRHRAVAARNRGKNKSDDTLF